MSGGLADALIAARLLARLPGPLGGICLRGSGPAVDCVLEALAELGRHKADLSRNFSTTWLETWLIMRLGRLDEARQRNEIFFPEMTRPFRLYLGTNWWFNPITQNLLLGERAKAVALMRDAVGFPEGRTVLRNGLGLDPRMRPFRDDPEIKAILAEPEGKK